MESSGWGLLWIERWEEVSLGDDVQTEMDEEAAGVGQAGQRQRNG